MKLKKPKNGHLKQNYSIKSITHESLLLGSLPAAAVLASEGSRAVNLGARTPIATLVETARRLGARLVWVSVSNPPEPERVPGLVAGSVRPGEPAR